MKKLVSLIICLQFHSIAIEGMLFPNNIANLYRASTYLKKEREKINEANMLSFRKLNKLKRKKISIENDIKRKKIQIDFIKKIYRRRFKTPKIKLISIFQKLKFEGKVNYYDPKKSPIVLLSIKDFDHS